MKEPSDNVSNRGVLLTFFTASLMTFLMPGLLHVPFFFRFSSMPALMNPSASMTPKKILIPADCLMVPDLFVF